MRSSLDPAARRNPNDPAVRVLYMEDDAGLARLFQKHLQRAGYAVDLAPDGNAGLEKFAEGSHDILVVDYKMPGRDGLEVINTLAASKDMPPLIMLTANGDEALAVDALQRGAGDYIVKDTAAAYIRLLPSRIEQLLEKHRLQEAKRLAQEALRSSEERLREITESASDAIVSFDEARHIVLWNQAAEAILGYRAEEMQGQPLARIIPQRHRGLVDEEMERVHRGDGGRHALEMEVLRIDKQEISVEASFSASETKDGRLYTTILRDITDRRRTQNALQEAARLEATATLASGLAHQFNNLLFGVRVSTELLQMRLEDRPDAIGRLEMISQQAEKASELVQQMLAFTRSGHYQPVVMSFNDSVREALQSLGVDASDRARLVRRTDASLWKISADPTQMVQLVANLLTNALEAIDGEGTVVVATSNLRIDSESSEQGLEPGLYVCLEVSDDGVGMSPEVLNKIYTPFFTTKFQGRGLGMSAVWGTVKHHSGQIEVSSQPGSGTIVKVYLPAIDSEVRRRPRSSGLGSAPRGSETVLLIDEEDVFLSVARELLEFLGYRVLLAHTGAEAVAIAREHRGTLHLVLMEISSSLAEPVKTYADLVDARPDLRFILCSSSERGALAERLLEAGASSFLRKPFGLEVLGLEIRRVLDGF
ncbi:MAG: response regulator [Acidobacteriota bacterium]